MKPKVCISYSSQDANFMKEVRKRVEVMEDDGLVELWADHKIQAGDLWDDKIKEE